MTSVHVASKYRVEYATETKVNGYGEISEFINWLRSKNDERVTIGENEDWIEITTMFLVENRKNRKWGKVCDHILRNMDTINGYARLDIW